MHKITDLSEIIKYNSINLLEVVIKLYNINSSAADERILLRTPRSRGCSTVGENCANQN